MTITIRYEYSTLLDTWYYRVYKNDRYQNSYAWKWCAIRFAKKLAKQPELVGTEVYRIEV